MSVQQILIDDYGFHIEQAEMVCIIRMKAIKELLYKHDQSQSEVAAAIAQQYRMFVDCGSEESE